MIKLIKRSRRERVPGAKLNLYSRERCRNSVSDETVLAVNLGTHLNRDFYIRRNGNLICTTFENSILPVRSVDLGSEKNPENIALYYRNLKDAKIFERRVLVESGIISKPERDRTVMGSGDWDRKGFIDKYSRLGAWWLE